MVKGLLYFIDNIEKAARSKGNNISNETEIIVECSNSLRLREHLYGGS